MPGQFNTDPDLDGVHASTYGNGASGVAGINHSKTAPQAGVPGGNGVFGYTVNPFAAGVSAPRPAAAPGSMDSAPMVTALAAIRSRTPRTAW